MQQIIYPTELKYADSIAMLQMGALKNSFLEGPEEKIFKYLQRLPDILKNSIKKAQEENPERCKRELVTIRCEALLYYNLDDIPYWQCNMLLYQLKPELKYYIDETERIYNSLEATPSEPSKPLITEVETPRSSVVKERLTKYGFHTFLQDHAKLTVSQITEIENLLCLKELPYCIALLNGLGYLEYFKTEYCGSKSTDRDKLLAVIFDVTSRRIKGNINVLNPMSSEDRTNYTSHQYIEIIDKLLKGR